MISIVSDVHIKFPGDEPFKLFMRFLNNPIVNRSEKVVLLGDIFDFVVGGNKDFIKEFSEVFDKLKAMLENGIEIYYIEGNHDFHIEKLMKEVFPEKGFKFSKGKVHVEHQETSVLLCHGDDIEIENPSYRRYYKIIRSRLIEFLAEEVVPFSITRKIGIWASSRSRKKNIDQYESKKDLIKTKFRNSAEELFKTNPTKLIISGHSHVKDHYQSKSGFTYANNGFFPAEKTFIVIEKDQVIFNELVGPSH